MRNFNRKKVIGWFIAALVLIGIIATNVYQQQRVEKTEKQTIKIAFLYPLTGNAGFVGKSAQKAVDFFWTKNDKDKMKYNYEIIWEDSRADAAQGVSAARKLTDYDNVDLIISTFSSVSSAIAPIMLEKKVAHLSFAQDKAISNGFYNYRVVTSTEKTGAKTAELLDRKGYHNIVSVVLNAAGTISLYRGFENLAKSDPRFNIIETYYITPNERDFRITIEKIKLNEPEAILLVTQSPDTDNFLRQFNGQETNIPVLAIQSFNLLQDKALAEGNWYVDVAHASDDFYNDYYAFTGDKTTNWAENVYTTLLVAVHDYETIPDKARPTAEDFINNLKSANELDSPIGKLIFDGKNQNIDSEANILRITDGKVVKEEN